MAAASTHEAFQLVQPFFCFVQLKLYTLAVRALVRGVPMMTVAVFCLLLLSPCIVAFIGYELVEASRLDEVPSSPWKLPRWRRARLKDPEVRVAEESLVEGFVVRSFPKGISQRRIVVQDVVQGVRLTISQVRAAIVETARTVRAAYQRINETRAQLLKRLADEARMVSDRQIMQESARAPGAEYAEACERLRWSEVTSEQGWASVAA
jgi:hypothetical protein